MLETLSQLLLQLPVLDIAMDINLLLVHATLLHTPLSLKLDKQVPYAKREPRVP